MGKIMVNNTKRLFRKTCFSWIFLMLVPLLYSSLLGNTAQWFDQPGECPQQPLLQQFDHLFKIRTFVKMHQFGLKSWVTTTDVNSCCSSSFQKLSTASKSIPVVGSSKKINFGWFKMVNNRDKRLFWPPERLPTICSLDSLNSTISRVHWYQPASADSSGF